MRFRGGNQDYQKSGFAKNTIALGLNMCVQNVMIFYKNEIPGRQSRLPEIRIRKKYNCIGLQYVWPEYKDFDMKMKFRGAIKITRNPDSQKIQLHWATICVARI